MVQVRAREPPPAPPALAHAFGARSRLSNDEWFTRRHPKGPVNFMEVTEVGAETTRVFMWFSAYRREWCVNLPLLEVVWYPTQERQGSELVAYMTMSGDGGCEVCGEKGFVSCGPTKYPFIQRLFYTYLPNK